MSTMQEFYNKQIEERYNQRMIQIKALEKLEGSTQIIEAKTAVQSYTDEFRLGLGGGFRGTCGLIFMMMDKLGYYAQIHEHDLWFNRYGDTGSDTLAFSQSMQQWIADMPDVWPTHINVSPTVDEVKEVALIVEDGVLKAINLEEWHKRTLSKIEPIAWETHHRCGRQYYASQLITRADPVKALVAFEVKIQRALHKATIIEAYNDVGAKDINKPPIHCVIFEI